MHLQAGHLQTMDPLEILSHRTHSDTKQALLRRPACSLQML